MCGVHQSFGAMILEPAVAGRLQLWDGAPGLPWTAMLGPRCSVTAWDPSASS